MDSNPVVFLDISSDEEDVGTKVEPGLNTLDWIAETLGVDDVVVVDDIPDAARNVKESSENLKWSRNNVADDSDDDCVMLDGDPDKPVAVAQTQGTVSDDLLIVSEKGQIACRDYPHPRHLCATFPFSQTPHEKHCNQCHCYVCDSLAPCAKWGNGSSLTDHCHANDKGEGWKQQRQCLKTPISGLQPGVPANGTLLRSHSVVPPLVSPSMTQAINGLGPLPPVGNISMPPLLQTPRACSANSLSTPNLVGLTANEQMAALVQPKHRYMHSNIPNMMRSVAPASRHIQRARPGGRVGTAFSHYKRMRTTNLDVINVQMNISEQAQAGSISHGHSLNQMLPNVGQRLSLAVPSVNGHAFTPTVTQSNLIPSVSVSNESDYASPTAPPMYDNQTIPVLPIQQATPNSGDVAPTSNMEERLNEIFASLQSELSLAQNTISSVPHAPPSLHGVGDQSSPFLFEHNVNADAGQAHPTGMDASALIFNPSNISSRDFVEGVSVADPQPQLLQPVAISAAPQTDSSSLGKVSLQGWGSHLDRQELRLTASGVPPTEPPNVIFDFEDLLGL